MNIVHDCKIITSFRAPLGAFKVPIFYLVSLAPRYEHACNTSLKVKVCVLVRHLWAAVAVSVSDNWMSLPWLHLYVSELRGARGECRKYWLSPCGCKQMHSLVSAEAHVWTSQKVEWEWEWEGTRSPVPNNVGGWSRVKMEDGIFFCHGMRDREGDCCTQVSEVLTEWKRFPWQRWDAWIYGLGVSVGWLQWDWVDGHCRCVWTVEREDNTEAAEEQRTSIQINLLWINTAQNWECHRAEHEFNFHGTA